MSLDPKLKVEIQALFDLLDTLDYYKLLKVSSTAKPHEIKKAFLNESKRFHPDRYFSIEDDVAKRQVTSIYKRIAEAYTVLRRDVKRSAYDQQLADPSVDALRFQQTDLNIPSGAAEVVTKHPNAKKFFLLAAICIENKDYSGAEMNFQFALRYEPDNQALKDKLEEAREARYKKEMTGDPYKIR